MYKKLLISEFNLNYCKPFLDQEKLITTDLIFNQTQTAFHIQIWYKRSQNIENQTQSRYQKINGWKFEKQIWFRYFRKFKFLRLSKNISKFERVSISIIYFLTYQSIQKDIQHSKLLQRFFLQPLRKYLDNFFSFTSKYYKNHCILNMHEILPTGRKETTNEKQHTYICILISLWKTMNTVLLLRCIFVLAQICLMHFF